MERSDSGEYYLQVVKDGSLPQWPRPEDELVVGSQSLEGGYTQYWAYLKESGKEADELPHAEVIASENRAEREAILIDQYGSSGGLELVLVRDGHAWGKEETSVGNLEDNISSLLDFASDKFNMGIEHFMTTTRVSQEVEKKLDELEEAGEVTKEPEDSLQSTADSEQSAVSGQQEAESSSEAEDSSGAVEEDMDPSEKIRFSHPASDGPLGSGQPVYRGGATGVGSFSKQNGAAGSSKAWLIPVVLVIVLFAGALFFKETIVGSLKGTAPIPTPTPVTAVPTATPTPTPTLDRSQYKVRVLNGTTKTGVAGTLADDLKALGWEILSKGNAKDQATAQTTVRVKEGNEQVAETLIADLAPDLEASAGAVLPASDKADAEVVIGKK